MIWIEGETTQIIELPLLCYCPWKLWRDEMLVVSCWVLGVSLTWRTPWPARGRRRGCCRCRAPRRPGWCWAGCWGPRWSRPGRTASPPSSTRTVDTQLYNNIGSVLRLSTWMPFSSFISPHGKSFSVTSWIIRHVNNAQYSVKASTDAFLGGDNLFNIYDCDIKVLVGSFQAPSNIVYTCLSFPLWELLTYPEEALSLQSARQYWWRGFEGERCKSNHIRNTSWTIYFCLLYLLVDSFSL